jgi:hypothetical protein
VLCVAVHVVQSLIDIAQSVSFLQPLPWLFCGTQVLSKTTGPGRFLSEESSDWDRPQSLRLYFKDFQVDIAQPLSFRTAVWNWAAPPVNFIQDFLIDAARQ